MTAYLNEEQQVEALKKWWKENGRSVVIGVALGLAGIFGWQGWQAYRVSQGEAASSLYVSMRNQVSAGNAEGALELGKRLLGEHTDSIYASFAALGLARMMYQRGDRANAAENLQWVESHAPDAVIVDLARLRLARVRLDQEQYDQAARVLERIGESFMPAAVAELRGDIARARGDREAAREAYRQSLAAGDARAVVRMKLAELGAAEKAS